MQKRSFTGQRGPWAAALTGKIHVMVEMMKIQEMAEMTEMTEEKEDGRGDGNDGNTVCR